MKVAANRSVSLKHGNGRIGGLRSPAASTRPGSNVSVAVTLVIAVLPVLVTSILNLASRRASAVSGPVIFTESALASTSVVTRPSASRTSALAAKALRTAPGMLARQFSSTTLIIPGGRSPSCHCNRWPKGWAAGVLLSTVTPVGGV